MHYDSGHLPSYFVVLVRENENATIYTPVNENHLALTLLCEYIMTAQTLWQYGYVMLLLQGTA